MEKFDLNNIFQGISTLLQSDPSIMYARIGLILLGILLVYLGRRVTVSVDEEGARMEFAPAD